MAAGNFRTTRQRFFLLGGTLSIVGLVCAIIFGSSETDTAKLLGLATSRQPERLTELYFNDHVHLPRTVPADRATSISYHITNQESRDMVYHPRVTMVENGALHILPSAPVVLADGSGADITVTFQVAGPSENIEIIIDLPEQQESIHFRSES